MLFEIPLLPFVAFVMSSWCIVSPSVRDGIVGKLLLGVVAVSAYAAMVSPCNALALQVMRLASLATSFWFVVTLFFPFPARVKAAR